MAALMLESSGFHPNSGFGGDATFAPWEANRYACLSLAQAMCFDGHGQSNNASSGAAWGDNQSGRISLAQAMPVESGSGGNGVAGGSAFAPWDGQNARISLANAMSFEGGNESSQRSSTFAAWDSNPNPCISLAQAMSLDGGSKSHSLEGGSTFATREANQHACISLAQAVALPGSSGSSSRSGSATPSSQASTTFTPQARHANNGRCAGRKMGQTYQTHSTEVPWALPTSSTSEEDDVAGTCAGPVRLTLSQMLNNQGAASAPGSRRGSFSEGLPNDDACVRNDGTIALALALTDESPSSASYTSQPVEASGWSQHHIATQAISLHAAVSPPQPMPTRCSMETPFGMVGAPPGLGPQPLLLASHLVGEEPGDAKEDDVLADFLATPLPFVGRTYTSM